MKTPKPSNKYHAAFTMVELLVVITIIAVLAALLFSLASRMRTNASSAISTSNLRQIGTAIMAYAGDNNSSLPGPILTDHFPRYQNNAVSGQLGWLLRDHLASERQPANPQPRMFYTAALDYPAAKTEAKNPRSSPQPTYLVFAKQTDELTRTTFWPLGNYNESAAGSKTPTMTTAQLAGKEMRGKPWITETDQTLRPSTSRYGAPKEPPHGKSRNTLMFDFSVKPIPMGEFDPS